MWTKLFDDIKINVQTKVLPSKGNLVYEYNPFRNYRLSSNMYEYEGGLYSIGDLYNQFGIGIKCKAGRKKIGNIYYYEVVSSSKSLSGQFDETTNDVSKWIPDIYKEGKNIDRQNFEQALDKAKLVDAWTNVKTNSSPILREKGELVDFITDELNISLEHPLHIIPQHSYDGSVNLIINDGINIPRLINSRFSATGKNTYEIIDRKGNNDTNIYDQGEQFDSDTSLYKRVNRIPKIEFKGVQSGGNLKVGNYHFYFKLSDADGNETDFIGESGLVSIFVGRGSYYSVHTGQKHENSFKQVQFTFENIDSAYNYMIVYYSRSTAEGQNNSVTEYIKINKKFLIQNSDRYTITITGYEDTEVVTIQDINLLYNVVDASQTSAVCQNMLFMANVHKPDIPYQELSDLSLRFLPYLKEENYDVVINQDYSINTYEQGYIDPAFIYNKTGYWGEELYRIGIVYILPNGQLSPVFNIRGANKITKYSDSVKGYTSFDLFDKEGKRVYIDFNEQTNYIIDSKGSFELENVKGVISLNPTLDTNTIYSLDIRVDDNTMQELKKYVKGYFFVRQTRIPTILTQAVTIGIDNQSRTPTLPTAGGIIEEYQDLFQNTHVETDDLGDVNYISEGFLSRFTFNIKEKESEGWKTALKIGLIAVAAVGAVALTVFMPVAGGAIAAAIPSILTGTATVASTVTGAIAAGAGVVASSALVTGTTIVGGAAIVGAGAYAAGEAIATEIARKRNKITLNGRNTVIPKGYQMNEISDSRKLTPEFGKRFILKDSSKNSVQAMICPDYSVNQSYFNQIFTGNKHLIKTTKTQGINKIGNLSSNYFTSDSRHFYIPNYYDFNTTSESECKIITVPEGIKATGIDNLVFRSKAGEAEESWRYEFIGQEYKEETMNVNGDKKKEEDDKVSLKKINSDIVRGIYCPYLAFNNPNNTIGPAETVNIYIPEYSINNINNYFQIRMQDNSSYYAIGDRIDIQESDNYLVKQSTALLTNIDRSSGYTFNMYRGDCYICQFTQRIIRNFNDPTAPYNDDIVDANSWKKNYDPSNTEKYAEINQGDVNAVPLGMWLTFKVRSSNNLNIRTLDGSNIDESAMSGHERGFYPYYPMSVEGSYKIPDSQVYNKGFTKSVSERINVQVPDVPHIKNWFGTRIMYSDIHINDAYKNGFRVFQGTNYRDYTREYGEITKLVPFESSLLVIFEHGIAMLPVNERAVAGQGAGGNVYINTSNVLPENPMIISDMFGSQWPESILKVPGKTGDAAQYVYGVDTVAKKIWRTDGQRLECISDMRVQEFLNNNITLGERELTPKIGIRNVKTVYNAFKRDVLFTFYDNTYGFEEKVWNLCWNEILGKFITFYSWVPSYMENINNIPFSFNRDTSKWIAKLGTSHSTSSIADGITLSNVITNDRAYAKNGQQLPAVDNYKFPFTYINKEGDEVTKYYEVAEDSRDGFIGVLSLSNRTLPDTQLFYQISYTLERDNYLNYESFEIVPVNVVGQDIEGGIKLPNDVDTKKSAMYAGNVVPIYALKFKSQDSTMYHEVSVKNEKGDYPTILLASGSKVYTYKNLYNTEALLTELYYRNSAGNAYADYDTHKVGPELLTTTMTPGIWYGGRVNTDGTIEPYNGKKEGEGQEDYQAAIIRYIDLISQATGGTAVDVGNSSNHTNVTVSDDGFLRSDPVSDRIYICTNTEKIKNLLTWRNGEPYVHGIRLNQHWTVDFGNNSSTIKVHFGLPIFKDITGKRQMLPKDKQLNPDKIVTLLNIRANIQILDEHNTNKLSDDYYNMKAGFASGTSLVDAGYYESVVAITPKWNLQFLSTDFWKHGQAGIIDIADDIYPTYWYGKQHPFEFECVVVNDPSIHKIFTNLELIANKAKPESFHYEIVGETYDFAKDKPNMYFRQEALKALWQYNGADICYNRNFLKVQPKNHGKSADLPHTYYARQDTINEVEDYYINATSITHDYKHLSGSEIVYYPNRQEFRIWNHALAVNLDDLSQDDARSIIAANCQYLEDRWRININPILVCYKNEKWTNRPKLPIMNSPIPTRAYETIAGKDGIVEIPEILTNLGYTPDDMDQTNWLNDPNIYGTYFGEAQNRREVDIRDKFMKVRIRYTGDELAIIDFLNTIYRVSYA